MLKLDIEREYPSACLPLYFARMLLELRYHAIVQDRTIDLTGLRGHRFVIDFPA